MSKNPYAGMTLQDATHRIVEDAYEKYGRTQKAGKYIADEVERYTSQVWRAEVYVNNLRKLIFFFDDLAQLPVLIGNTSYVAEIQIKRNKV